ncbi:MAG: hypothetical protein AAB547_02445, partial [Patescibacteria group bacterium]
MMNYYLDEANAAAGRDLMASKLVKKAEFGHKDRGTIGMEEKMWNIDVLSTVSNLENDNFVSAERGVRESLFPDDLDSKGFKDIWEAYAVQQFLHGLLRQRVEALVLSGNMEKMKEVVSVYNLGTYSPNAITLKILAKMPKEIIQSPDVQERLSHRLEIEMLGIRRWGISGDPKGAQEMADEYVELGLMTKEQADKTLAGATEAAR